jgi:glycosyltransferase involved in cell wall biosynthesis
MRVAHIITRMIVGGAQENTLFNCQDLVRDHGDEVFLLTGPSPGPEGELLQQVQPGGTQMITIPSLRRAIHPWHDWRAYRQIKKQLKRLQPDVVHTHSAKAGMLGRLAAWSLKLPVVVHTVHGAPFHPYQSALARRLFRRCEKFAARRCRRLISVADAMTDQLVEAGVADRDKFITIQSGMDVASFTAANQLRSQRRQELGFEDDQVVVGKIARLFPLKGHCYLVEAAAEIVEYHPEVHFLLVGDGILRATLEQQIEAAGLADHFHFTGLVPPDQIPGLIGAMDLLVHTSLREGLARALPQALLAGKPVISYDVDGAREVVIPDQTGILLPARAIEPLAEAVCRLAADRALRERLGKEGQRRFSVPFGHQQMTRRIRALYEDLLG